MTKPGDPLCWTVIGVQGDASCPELKQHVHCRSCPVFAAAGRSLFSRPAPEGYLSEWAQTLAKPPPKDAAKSESAVIFRLGREWLALETAVLVEVAAMRKPRRVAHRSSNVLSGLVNIRGQLELCVSLRSLLRVQDGATTDEAHRRLVVVEREKERWAFDADEVHGVFRYAKEELEAVPSTLSARSHDVGTFARAMIVWAPRRAALLDSEEVWNALRQGVG